jgi:hypothetical protein
VLPDERHCTEESRPSHAPFGAVALPAALPIAAAERRGEREFLPFPEFTRRRGVFSLRSMIVPWIAGRQTTQPAGGAGGSVGFARSP